MLNNETVLNLCKNLFDGKFDIWDEGYGNVAFRLIRPLGDDGYPLSKKTWGPGGYLLSILIPLVCPDPNSGIGLVPGSHKFDHPSSKDISGKFEDRELRYSGNSKKLNVLRPMKLGQMILMHPNLLHCEAVGDNPMHSRLSLEIRINGNSDA